MKIKKTIITVAAAALLLGTFGKIDGHAAELYDGEGVAGISMMQEESSEAQSVYSAQTDGMLQAFAMTKTASYGSIHGSQFDGATILAGIDVSKWNGTIDWTKVAQTQKFTFIRVGGRYSSSGGLYSDSKYKENIENAYDAGLDVGVYFFSQAITADEAKKEAEYILSLVESYKSKINLPIVFDFEYYSGGRLAKAKLSDTQRTEIVNAFCKTVEDAGYTACLYANISMIVSDLNISSIDDKYAVWVARYNTRVSTTTLAYDKKYAYWQYSSTGSVSGISGNVDMNHGYQFNPGTVTGLKTGSSESYAIDVTWDKQVGVYGYQVYRCGGEDDSYKKIATLRGASTTSYTDKKVELDEKYTYKVRAIYKQQSGNVTGSFSSAVSAETMDAKVRNLEQTDATTTSVTLQWDAVDKVAGYEVYRYDSASSSYKKLTTLSSSTTSYTDSGLSAGIKYYYQVRAYAKKGSTIRYGQYTTAKVTTKPSSVSTFSLSARGVKSLLFSWTAVTGADGYEIWIYDTEEEKYQQAADITSGTTLSGKVTDLRGNMSYQLCIRAYSVVGEERYYSTFSPALTAQTKPAKVSGVEKVSVTKNTVTLEWSKCARCTGYYVYRYNDSTKTWDKIATLTGAKKLTYTDTERKRSTKYQYQIVAYKKWESSTIFTSMPSEIVSAKTK
jgi:GH25 family lysozyme M1 (1,4-beta-N-acetylmuramidase)